MTPRQKLEEALILADKAQAAAWVEWNRLCREKYGDVEYDPWSEQGEELPEYQVYQDAFKAHLELKVQVEQYVATYCREDAA